MNFGGNDDGILSESEVGVGDTGMHDVSNHRVVRMVTLCCVNSGRPTTCIVGMRRLPTLSYLLDTGAMAGFVETTEFIPARSGNGT